MLPKLHRDTIYTPIDGGVYVRNNRASLTLKGEIIYRWLEQLTPYLNGQHSLDEITRELDATRRQMVSDLVKTLFEHHFLMDVSLDQPHTLSQAELNTYASEIAFIETFQSSAARRFELFRQTRVLVIGSGVTYSVLVRSCLQGGIKFLSVIRTIEEEPVCGVYSPLDDSSFFLPRDPSQQIQELKAPCWNDKEAVFNLIKPFDVILHISDHPMLARARLLNALCVEQEKTLLQACFLNDQVWVGPLVKPDTEGCWECAWRRLQSTLQDEEQVPWYAFHDQGTLPPGRWFAFPIAAIAANRLVFDLFKTITLPDVRKNTGMIVSIDLKTLTSSNHSFAPHPHCQACQHPSALTEEAFDEKLEQTRRRMPGDLATFSKQAARCFDTRTGIFTSIDEGGFEQIPLAVCKVTVSNPAGFKPRTVIAVGRNFTIARQRATRRACEVYASTLVDIRCLVTEKTPEVLPRELFLLPAFPVSATDAWTWALDLDTQQRCLVPASLVFPSLQQREPIAPAEYGIGSGFSWSEAAARALLDWARYLTIAQLNADRHFSRKVDLSSLSLTSEGDHLLSLLATVEAQPDVYDITGSLGIPTFAICAGTRTIAYSTHWDTVEALVGGLELALRQYQSEQAQQPEYAVEPVPQLLISRSANQSTQLRCVSAPHEWSSRLAWLVQRFRENGWLAIITPLNHDPTLVEVLPFLVRVLLMQEEKKKEQIFV